MTEELNKKIIFYSGLIFGIVLFFLSVSYLFNSLYLFASLAFSMSVVFSLSSFFAHKNFARLGFHLSITVTILVIYIFYPTYRFFAFAAQENFIGAILSANLSVVLVIYCALVSTIPVTIVYSLSLLTLNIISIKFAAANFHPLQTGIPMTTIIAFISTLLVVVFKKLRDGSEISLKALAESEKEANQAKTNFLANMSHEIRTPMNGIIGMANLMLDDELPTHQRQKLGVLVKSAESLMLIINDILDISKIESGKLELHKNEISMNEMFAELASFFLPMAKTKNLNLVFPKLETDFFYLGDFIRLRQILINLLGNALKFTDKGNVKLSWENVPLSDHLSKVYFHVVDTGIGIAESNISKLFQKFKQADDGTTKRFGGTGLGLSICKELVSLMDGEIWIESKEGEGSQFHFFVTLPRAEPFQRKILHQTEKVPDKINKYAHYTAKTLVVEDNETNQLVISGMLKKIQNEIIIVSSGSEAIEAVLTHHFDLILMDIQMADMDGYQTTKQIRNLQKENRIKNQGIFIVALTANAMNTDREKCLDAGMDDFLTKPFTMTDLITIYDKYLIDSRVES